MANNNENKKVRAEDLVPVKGELTYDDKVIQKIVGTAVEKISGLLTVDGGFFSNVAQKLVNTNDVTSGIETEVGKKQVAVDMDVVIEYGKDIPAIADQIKTVIHDEVAKMTHLDVIEVNIHIVDIKTRADYEKDSQTVQDKVTNAAQSTGQFASQQANNAKGALNQGADQVKQQVNENNQPRVQ